MAELAAQGKKSASECPFYEAPSANGIELEATLGEKDVLGLEYDFVLEPVPGEPSARKIVLPFRPDIVEKMDIKRGDIVLGRPMGAGCPVQHVLEVIEADPLTGLLKCWVVGPKHSRDKPEGSVKDVKAYHMIGFEGMARTVKREPTFGLRQRFLPGCCMMNIGHTAVVNTVLKKKEGIFVRLENILILSPLA